MEISLIATAAMTILGPYVTKAAESVAEKIGEDLWTKVKKTFTKDKEKEIVKKVEENSITRADLNEIQNILIGHLNQDNNLLEEVKTSLNIIPANEFILENNLKIAEKIREELKFIYEGQINAGIESEGGYINRIALQERKLKRVEENIIAIITKK
jgi:hypothetical protein